MIGRTFTPEELALHRADRLARLALTGNIPLGSIRDLPKSIREAGRFNPSSVRY